MDLVNNLDSPSHNSKLPDPRSLTSFSEVLSCLSALQSEEVELSHSLTRLLATRAPIFASLAPSRLQSLSPHFDQLHAEASRSSEKVSRTARTADRVGGRVRSLDEEMKRVREAAERVGQIMDLKSSLAALQSDIDAQNWESAARHCIRAMSIPHNIVSGRFSEVAVPTSASHHPPAQTLQAAREHLLAVFQRQFEQASKAHDSALTSRYFKLFPVIGWEEEGLQAYALFVVDLVQARTLVTRTASPHYYINALTALFESIAVIVDQHQAVVEKYYGPGKMLRVVERLLEECDKVTKDIIERWEEERAIKRRMGEIKLNPAGPTSSRRLPQAIPPDGDVVDPREIDKLLSEMAEMTGRWYLFHKFLSESIDEPTNKQREAGDQDWRLTVDTEPPSVGGDVSQCIRACRSHRLFEDVLSTYYMPFELWYVNAIIEKAHRLSTHDSSQGSASTTTPDDVFYILKVVLSRLLSIGSLQLVQQTLEQLRDIMERDYAAGFRKKLDDVFRSSGTSNTSSSRVDKLGRENRIAFITHLNDLDISSSHLEQLIKDMLGSPLISQHFTDHEQSMARDALSSFASVASKFRLVLRLGVEQVFNQLMRPKLRNFLSDVYKDISYVLDDELYAAAEYQDSVRKRFTKAWEGCMEGYKDVFTETNYRIFFDLTIDVLLRPWENLATGLRYSELGAIKFDRDLRSITAYLASQTVFGDVREKFIRLQQISTLLNLDKEEGVDEFYNSSGITWKLSAHEAQAITGLRV